MLNFIKEKLAEEEAELLHATYFGSSLYGLSTKKSDTDVCVVYLPSKDKILTKKCKWHFEYKSGSSNSKNTSEDVDISFISLHEFFDKLAKCEVKSIDVLFSLTNTEQVISTTPYFIELYTNRNKLINIENVIPFIGYALNQVKKYGLKGTMVGVYKDLISHFEEKNYKRTTRVVDVYQEIKEIVGSQYSFEKFVDPFGIQGFRLFHSTYLLTTPLHEYVSRIKLNYDKLGERAKLACENKGIDYKACSHALRSLYEYYSLSKTGNIEFPFIGGQKNILMKIKLGEITWKEYEKLFLEEYAKIDQVKPEWNAKALKKYTEQFILNLYKDR